jgi:hypothetical protein
LLHEPHVTLLLGRRLIERAGNAPGRRNRAELAAQRDQANKVLTKLKVEKAKIVGAQEDGRR